MSRFASVLLVMIICTSIYAFDEGPDFPGNIPRPGYDNLQVNYLAVSQNQNAGKVYAENELVGTPRAISLQYQSGVSAANAKSLANNFIASHADLLKNGIDNFRVASSKLILNKFYFVNLIQTFNNVDIYGSRLGLRATPDGRVFFAGGEIFASLDVNTQPSVDRLAGQSAAVAGIEYDSNRDKIDYDNLYILPLIYDDKIDYRLCYEYYVNTIDPAANWRVFVDAHDGSVIWREDITRYETVSGNISGMIQPATPYDPQEQQPFPNLDFYADGYLVATTDSEGNYSFDIPGGGTVGIDLLLEGPYLNVDNMIGADAWYGAVVYPGDTLNLVWNDENSTIPQHNAFYHGQVVHDYINALDPDLGVMDFPMVCRVNVSGSCNAFYSRQDRSVNFYREGGGCPNIAQIGDVVYHEWGHGLTNLTYYYGGFQDPNGAMHEGFSDVIAAFVTNQPLIGRGFYGPGSHLRTVDNDNRFPEDWSGESHNDGLIISGALWDLKEMLGDQRPNYIDTLWQYAKYGYSSDFEGYFWDVLTVDDDDGNLDNGTPHAFEIFYSFGELHGIGPGIPIEIDHTPIIDSEDSTVTYPVDAVVSSLFSMDEGSVTVYYSTGGEYIPLAMENTSGNNWSAEIPSQSFGTTVNYYIEAIDNVNLRKYYPENAPDEVFTFYVGFDLIPPTMTQLSGPDNTINLFGPYGDFGFYAWDIHGIDDASGELHFKINDGNESSLPMAYDTDNGEFALSQLDLDQTLQTGDVVNYYFTCRDMAINQNTGRLPETGFFDFEISTSELIGQFEDGSDGWEIVGEGWIFYDQQGYQSNHCIKTGEVLYPDNANSLIYCATPFNLSLFDEVWLEFMRRNFLRDGDSVYVVASNDQDGPWTRFEAIGGNQNFWGQHITNLPGMAGPGNEQVYVGLEFISDESDNYYGMVADEFIIHIATPTAVAQSDNLPEVYSLNQNYPNPFNIHTIISFSIPETSPVTLDIFDVLGRKVKQLVDGTLLPGVHQAIWDGRNERGEVVTSGVYFYKLTHGDKSEIKSMTLIK
jgi:hypothetical protein